MIDEKTFNKVTSIALIVVLVILSILILRPILTSFLFGLILSFIFYPVYRKIFLWTKNSNLSALIVCIILLAMITIPVFFFTPLLIGQTFNVYTYVQRVDVLSPFKNVFPNFFSSPEVSQKLLIAINSFASKIASSFMNKFTDILLNSPIILLRLFIILFVFFFGLRDGEKIVTYIQSLSPLSKESEKKIFQQFKDITYSVIFGYIVTGIAQGIVTGIALFVLKIPNALVLTLLAVFLSILPLGPWLIWIPVDLYLFSVGRTTAGLGLLIYGLFFISLIDNFIRPFIVSKKTKLNSGIVLVSMIGGLLVFGILGLILGPLIISYLLLLLDSFRNKKVESILVQKLEK